MTKQALAGIRVLDLSRIMAGPTAGQMLGDFGADVIKVERPGGGDDSRRLGGTPLRDAQGRHANLGPMFLCANRNKRSITVDIAKPEGQQLVRKLAQWADVVIENYKVGDLARYGLDYASLSAENPRLVYCSITGFGQTGPYAQRSGFDPIFQAMSGLMSVSGHPDDKPGGGMMRVGVPITDFICGLYAYGAIVTALYHRDQVSGRGQYIDLALLDAAISSTSIAAVDYLCNGALPQRFGNEAATSVPSQVIACADGAVLVSAPNNESFVRFCEALGEPDLAHHADFNDAALRIKNRSLLTPMLEKIFAHKKRQELIDTMEAHNVPCAPVYEMNDVFDDPQVQHRGTYIKEPHPVTGQISYGTNPVQMSDTPVARYTAPPMVGQHTDAILSEVLQLERSEIERLKAARVI